MWDTPGDGRFGWKSTPVEPVQLDGEPGGVTPFTATVVPAAIRIMVPTTT